MKSHAGLLYVLAFVAGLLESGIGRSDGPEGRNVLLVMVDDLNESLGCYGAPVESPHIDGLAARGVRFTRAYCQYPVCGASRASMITGRYPRSTGVLGNGRDFREQLPDAVTLPQLFRQHGYFTARVGKILHMGIPRGIGQPGIDDPHSWDIALNPAGIGPDRTFQEASEANRAIVEAHHPDSQVASEAIRLLRENRDKRFFLAVGFYRPHGPLIAPSKYYEAYDPSEIQPPTVTQEELDRVPLMAFREGVRPRVRGRHDARQLEIANYFACVTYVDAQIGRVLDELGRLGLRDSTIVVLVSDHGSLKGEHGLGGKSVLFEAAIRAPLIVATPDGPTAGSACSRIVEFVDLYPTIAELCGLEPPGDLEGTSFVDLLEDPQRPWKRAAFSVVRRGRDRLGESVRTERFHYIRWPDGSQELYDHSVDAGERNNIASDARYASIIDEMEGLLSAGWKGALPAGR